MAFNLGEIFATLKLKSEGVKEGADGMRNIGVVSQDASKKVGDFADNFQKGLKVASGALITVGAGLTVYAKQATDFTTDYVVNSKKLAREIGTTVEDASRLTAAFQRVGLTTDQVSSSFGIFSKQISAATADAGKNKAAYEAIAAQMQKTQFDINQTTAEIKKNGDASGELGIKLRGLQSDMNTLKLQSQDVGTAFDKLGINTTDATGKQKEFSAILFEVADKFKEMPNGVDKTALSMSLFGRSGKDMIPLLNKGSDGIKALETEADRLGITLTQKTIAGVDRLIESTKKMKENSDAMKIAVGTLTTPVLAKYQEMLAGLVGKFQDLNPPAKTFLANVLAFGGPIATATGSVLGFLGSFDQAKPALDAIIGRLPLVGAFFTALSGVLLNPWVIVIVGMAVAIGLLLDHMGRLQPMIDAVVGALQTLWGIMSGALQPAIDSVRSSLQVLAPYWPQFFQAIKVIAEIIGGIVVVALLLFSSALAGIVLILAYTIAAFAQFVVFMTTTWVSMWGSIYSITTTGWANMMTWFNAGVQGIHNIWNTLSQLPGRLASWLGAIPGSISNALQSAVNVISGWMGTFYNSGRALFEAFGRGINDAVASVKTNVNNGLSQVRKLLPFSDAKEGPLSDLTLSGRRLMETIATGVGQGSGSLYGAVADGISGLPMANIGANVGITGSGAIVPSSPSGGQSGSSGGVTIGTVVIEKDADSDYFFKKFGRNQDLSAQGLSTMSGSVGI